MEDCCYFIFDFFQEQCLPHSVCPAHVTACKASPALQHPAVCAVKRTCALGLRAALQQWYDTVICQHCCAQPNPAYASRSSCLAGAGACMMLCLHMVLRCASDDMKRSEHPVTWHVGQCSVWASIRVMQCFSAGCHSQLFVSG